MAIKTNYASSSTADDFVPKHDPKHDIGHDIGHDHEQAQEPALDYSSLGFPQPSRVYASPSSRASGDSGGSFLDISGFDLSAARFVRLGEDLLIVSGEGSILIESYFSGVRSSIWSAEFGFYSAELVASFLETSAINNAAGEKKYALGFLQGLFTSDDMGVVGIGVVESAEGDVQITRGGLVITVAVGDTIMLNDIISTGEDSEVFLRFADKMEFRLGSDGRLAIDEFIYDEMSSDGTQILSIISGAFSYASGLIAGKDPSSVELKTPYGTIGIRGTKILGKVEPIDSSGAEGNGGEGGKGGKGGLSVTILEGRVALLREGAEVADISGRFETLIVRGDSAGDYSYDISVLSVSDIISSYDFLDGSVEQLEEITGSSLSLGIGDSGGEAIDGDFSIASETAAEAVELSFIESSSATLAEATAEADADDEEDSSDEVFASDDITANDEIVESTGTSNNDIRGGAGNDVLRGTAGVDRIYGAGGRDELLGLGGNDELSGGADNDILVGGRGNDKLAGGAGADEYYFMVGDGSDIIVEVNENKAGDIVVNEVYFRSSASGDYVADDFSASVFSKGGNDLRINLNIGGTRQEVTLRDYFLETKLFELFFFASTTESVPTSIVVPNFVFGTSGVDTLIGTSGVDIFDGGAGIDTASYASAGSLIGVDLVDASQNTGDAAGDSYKSIENIIGATSYGNTLRGNGGNNKLTGGSSADTLEGGGGKDILTGGVGNDNLNGGVGVDKYYFEVGDGRDRITDADGGKLYFSSGGSGNFAASDFAESSFRKSVNGKDLMIDLVVGGIGQKVTIVNYYANPNAFSLSYNTADNGAYQTVDILNFVVGTPNGETLTGTAGIDIFRSLGGNDDLQGGGGADKYYFNIGDGEDSITDTGGEIFFKSSGTGNYASGDFTSRNFAKNGDDLVITLKANGVSQEVTIVAYFTNSAAFTFVYNVIANGVYTALSVPNFIEGSSGGETLTGTAVADVIYGLGGNDVLRGGAGDDVLEGGQGIDIYYFWVGDGNDRITDADGGGLLFHSGGTKVYAASDFSTSIFSKNGQDLVISLTPGGVAQSVTIVDYFSNSGTFTLRYDTVQGGAYTTLAIPNFIYGTAHEDTLTGTAGVDIIYGLDDGDDLYGGDGDDALYGGDGTDSLAGGAGADILHGGQGTLDEATYEGSSVGIRINLALSGAQKDFEPNSYGFVANNNEAVGDTLINIDEVSGSKHGDWLTGDDNSNHIFGRGGNDRIEGGDEYDYLSGGNGDDTIYGGAGGDFLPGGDGNDILYGEEGNDEFSGREGNDMLYGGVGADEYVFYPGDGIDKIIDTGGGELYFRSLNGIGGAYSASDFTMSSFTKTGQNLQIDLTVSGKVQQVTIVDYYNNADAFSIHYNVMSNGDYILVSDSVIPT